MALTRKEIADMTKEQRAEFMTKNWGLIKDACDKVGGETVEALKNMKPSLYGVGGTRVGGSSGAKWKTLMDKFENVGDKLNEFDVFKLLKIGEKETHALIKLSLKHLPVDERKHIAFVDGDYVLKAIGGEAPEGVIIVKVAPVKVATEAPAETIEKAIETGVQKEEQKGSRMFGGKK